MDSMMVVDPGSGGESKMQAAAEMVGQYPKLADLRKYWSLVVIVPENQFQTDSGNKQISSPMYLQQQAMQNRNKCGIWIPRFLHNRPIFEKVLFLLYIENFDAIPASFWSDFVAFGEDPAFLPNNLRTMSEIKQLELVSVVSSMLSREGTKVLFVDKNRIAYRPISNIECFQVYREENRLQCHIEGYMSLGNLTEEVLFLAKPAFDYPNPQEIALIKDVFKKILEYQIRLAPKDCLKFARIVETLIQGKTKAEDQIQKLTIIVLSECFANGVIENDLIYQMIQIGRIKCTKDLEEIGHIKINPDVLGTSFMSHASNSPPPYIKQQVFQAPQQTQSPLQRMYQQPVYQQSQYMPQQELFQQPSYQQPVYHQETNNNMVYQQQQLQQPFYQAVPQYQAPHAYPSQYQQQLQQPPPIMMEPPSQLPLIRPGPPALSQPVKQSVVGSIGPQQFVAPTPATIPMYQIKSDQIPLDFRPLLLQYIVEFISLVTRQFETANIQNIKKFNSLKKTLHNLSKNEITRRLKRMPPSQSKEKDFLLEIQKSDDNGAGSKDPDSTFQSVIIANTLFFLRVRQCLTMTGAQNDCSYDMEKVKLFSNENISHHFDGKMMNYSLTHASVCMKQPNQALDSYWSQISR